MPQKRDIMKKFQKLFSDLCCSACGNSFDENSFSVLREEEGLLVLNIVCSVCKKSFGIAVLGFNPIAFKGEPCEDDILELEEAPAPVNYDDVLDAHNFINSLEGDWMKYIPDKYKQ